MAFFRVLHKDGLFNTLIDDELVLHEIVLNLRVSVRANPKRVHPGTSYLQRSHPSHQRLIRLVSRCVDGVLAAYKDWRLPPQGQYTCLHTRKADLPSMLSHQLSQDGLIRFASDDKGIQSRTKLFLQDVSPICFHQLDVTT